MSQVDDYLTNLNKEQRQAVEHGNGPLLIVAGAGTGHDRGGVLGSLALPFRPQRQAERW